MKENARITITAHEKSYLAASIKISKLEKELVIYREALLKIEDLLPVNERDRRRISREALAEGIRIREEEK